MARFTTPFLTMLQEKETQHAKQATDTMPTDDVAAAKPAPTESPITPSVQLTPIKSANLISFSRVDSKTNSLTAKGNLFLLPKSPENLNDLTSTFPVSIYIVPKEHQPKIREKAKAASLSQHNSSFLIEFLFHRAFAASTSDNSNFPTHEHEAIFENHQRDSRNPTHKDTTAFFLPLNIETGKTPPPLFILIDEEALTAGELDDNTLEILIYVLASRPEILITGGNPNAQTTLLAICLAFQKQLYTQTNDSNSWADSLISLSHSLQKEFHRIHNSSAVVPCSAVAKTTERMHEILGQEDAPNVLHVHEEVYGIKMGEKSQEDELNDAKRVGRRTHGFQIGFLFRGLLRNANKNHTPHEIIDTSILLSLLANEADYQGGHVLTGGYLARLKPINYPKLLKNMVTLIMSEPDPHFKTLKNDLINALNQPENVSLLNLCDPLCHTRNSNEQENPINPEKFQSAFQLDPKERIDLKEQLVIELGQQNFLEVKKALNKGFEIAPEDASFTFGKEDLFSPDFKAIQQILRDNQEIFTTNLELGQTLFDEIQNASDNPASDDYYKKLAFTQQQHKHIILFVYNYDVALSLRITTVPVSEKVLITKRPSIQQTPPKKAAAAPKLGKKTQQTPVAAIAAAPALPKETPQAPVAATAAPSPRTPSPKPEKEPEITAAPPESEGEDANHNTTLLQAETQSKPVPATAPRKTWRFSDLFSCFRRKKAPSYKELKNPDNDTKAAPAAAPIVSAKKSWGQRFFDFFRKKKTLPKATKNISAKRTTLAPKN